MALDYGTIREYYRAEMQGNMLTSLSADFYEQVKKVISEKEESAKQSGDIMAMREVENLKKMLKDIMRIRMEKIAIECVRKGVPKGLTAEEQKFAEEVRKASEGLMEDRKTIKRLLVIKEVKPYRGQKGIVYGPFKEGEYITVPQEEATWLLSKGFVKEVYL
ncbi:MAG: hypothetical protein QW035_01450 [Candidatus Anstonellales archaeon]